jgi:predicted short-subunit dehydrogenase-like oxidoreductase (DUF2520 family)
MKRKPKIAIVGAGNLGSALAVALYRAGYKIDAVITRSRPGSLRRAKELARRVGSRALFTVEDSSADVIWFCVPDAEILPVAKALAPKLAWKGKVALHSSGALLSDELQPLRRAGASVASVHPLMTFVKRSQPALTAVPFAIEGDAAAVSTARGLVRGLGAVAYAIRKEDKAAYHAWGTFASPLLTALLVTTEHVAEIAGVERRQARRRMSPILLQTLKNYAAFGGADGFSGPIIRGDVETVRRHLRVLRKAPAARDVYVALAKAALDFLPAKKKGTLMRTLNEL